jgi:hypothetical protein
MERFHSNLLEEAPPHAMGQPMVLFSPIGVHVGVNDLLLTLWHYIMPKLPCIGQ